MESLPEFLEPPCYLTSVCSDLRFGNLVTGSVTSLTRWRCFLRGRTIRPSSILASSELGFVRVLAQAPAYGFTVLILDGPWGRVASSNVTPDPSGISYYDQALFTQVIRTGFVRARKLNQIMPWHTHRGMTDEDIVAMFAYLKTLKQVRHHVDNTEPPTFCKVCRQTYGGGNQN
jgi:hypothetical protein